MLILKLYSLWSSLLFTDNVQGLLGSRDVGLDYLFHNVLFYRSWISIYVVLINWIWTVLEKTLVQRTLESPKYINFVKEYDDYWIYAPAVLNNKIVGNFVWELWAPNTGLWILVDSLRLTVYNMNVLHTHIEICLSSLAENIEEAHVGKGIWIQITWILVYTLNSYVTFFYCQAVYSDPSNEGITYINITGHLKPFIFPRWRLPKQFAPEHVRWWCVLLITPAADGWSLGANKR